LKAILALTASLLVFSCSGPNPVYANEIRKFDQIKVERVVDGDTVDLTVDLGFGVKITDRFRLSGIDTPEQGRPGAKEATAALRGLLEGERRRVFLDYEKKDKYGRNLAVIYVFMFDDEKIVNVNKYLIESGHAKPYFGGRKE
jgi:micrococcal nuclease